MATKRTTGKRAAAPKKPPAKKKSEKALAPRTGRPDDPTPLRVAWAPRSTAGVKVTEDTALTYSAYWAGVNVLANAVAVPSWHVFRGRPSGEGRDKDTSHPVDWLLHNQANPETNAFDFRRTVIAHALTWGNGYAEIERDMAGRPVWLWQIEPDRVWVDRTARGRLVYEIWNPRQPNSVLDPEDVFHVRGLGYDGVVGYSVVRMAAQSLSLGLGAERYAADLFGNGSTPGGALKYPGVLSEQAKENLRNSWERVHRGPGNQHRVAVLEEGLEWIQTSLPPEDAQLIESRALQLTEVCRWLGVPPHKIADLSRAHFNNIEAQETEFVVDSLMRWIRALEVEADTKLFGLKQRGTYFTRINVNSRLRGDSQARSAFYSTMFDRGVFSVNDIREREDMNPIGSDGDKRFVPLNMQLLEKAGEEPPPGTAVPGEPAPDVAVEVEAEPKKEDKGLAVWALRPVFEEVIRRSVRREVHRAKDADKRLAGDKEKLLDWLGEFKGEHWSYMMKALEPPLDALAAGREVVGLYLRATAEVFCNVHETELDRLAVAAVDAGKLSEYADTWEGLRVGPAVDRMLRMAEAALAGGA
jgi:HK97 family phage portal protein